VPTTTSPRSLFVGRENEQKQFLAFLKQQTEWVFLVVGMAGQGKSRLLDRLAGEISSDVQVIKLDFANRALLDPLKILEEVSWRTQEHCGHQKTEIFISRLQDVRKQLLQQKLDVLNYLCNQNQAQGLDPDIQKRWQEEEWKQQQKVLEAFYAQLSTYHGKRPVFMFDTCEWLNEPENQVIGQWFKDDFLPALHQYIPVPCYVVLASRVRPQLGKINDRDQYLCELQGLDEAAVNKYMELVGIQDEERWKAFFNLAHGHPLCLSIVATLWQEQQDDQSVSDLPLLEEKFNEQAFIEFFQQRLDKRLKSPFRELTHYGVLLRSFDWELLRSVFQEDLSKPESYHHFEQFVNYSYVEEVFEKQGHKHYALHILLREVLVDNIRLQEPKKWQCYHERAFKYYKECQAIDQYYHAIALNECEGIDNWILAIQSKIDNSEILQLLQQIDYDHTLKLSDMSRAIYLYAWGQYYASNLQSSDAFVKYKQALDLLGKQLESALKHDSKNEKDRILRYKACILKAMGESQQDCKQWEEAINSYNKALELFRQQEDFLNEARILQAIGQVKLNYKDQWNEAIEHYEQALNFFHKEKNTFEEACILQAIGNIKQSEKKTWKESIDYYNRAFDLFQEQKDYYRSSLVQLSIGDTYHEYARHWRARLNQAYQSYQQALQQYQRIDKEKLKQLGRKELEADIYERIGKVQQDQGKLREAQGSYQQSLTLFQHIKDSAGEGRMLQAINEVQKFSRFKKLIAPFPQWMRIGLVVMVLLLIGGSIGSTALILLPLSSVIDSCLPSQEPTKAISITQTLPKCGSETIGISDGSFAFDLNRNNRDFKNVAANIQHHGNTSVAQSAWANAISADTSDAEAHIYQENLNVINTKALYVTFVVTTVLTPINGNFVGDGRDILQGAYVAQKEYNDRCWNAHDDCPLVRLLIANPGENARYAIYIAKQIILLKQVDRTFMGVVGWLKSSQTVNALPVLQEAHIPMVSSTASSDQLTGLSPYFFRVNAPDQLQGTIGEQYAWNKLDSKKVALFYDPNDAYSFSLAQAFRLEYIKKGGSIAIEEKYGVGSSDSLLSRLSDALKHQPDLIYFAGYSRDFIRIVFVGLNNKSGQINVMGGDGLYVPNDYPNDVQSSISFQPLYFTSFAHPDIWRYVDPTAPEPPFFQDYPTIYDPQKENQNTYGYTLADSNVILTYDAVKAIIQGYQNAAHDKKGQAITSDDLREGLREIDATHPLSGASGPIAFGPDGNPIHQTVVVLNGSSINEVKIKQFCVINQGEAPVCSP
jgi:ABC-type branched-subunit amino acid transport system substrate-binding protein